MAKSKKLDSQFPKIYRIITEKSGFPIFLASTIFLVVLIFLLLFNFLSNYQEYIKVSQNREEISSQINFWDSVMDKFPGFADASFNIAVLEYQLGNLQQSRQYLNKTFIYDPSFRQASGLEKDLSKKRY